MKKIIIVIACLIGMLFMSSCDKFLELTPRDQKVVSTVEDYRDILASYMRLLKVPNRSQEPVLGMGYYVFPRFDVARNLGIYTGETSLDLTLNSNYDKNKNEYTLEGKKLLTWMNTDPYIWDQYYSFLGPVNLIISGIRAAEGSDEDLRSYVLGEALTWRAFSYFKLLQYYSPYKNDKYGIPVYLHPDSDIGEAMPHRLTQTEVFRLILEDCEEACSLMEQTPSNSWNCAWRSDFVHGMMAAIYTWKAMSGAAEDMDWKNAEEHATKAMKGRALTNSPDVLRRIFDCKNVTSSTDFVHDEFSFRIMDGTEKQVCNLVASYYERGLMVNGKASAEYYEKFADNDIRKGIYFTADGLMSDKYNLMGETNGGCILLFRLAEMYLIKAEALARQGRDGEAREVMKEFKANRYVGTQDIPDSHENLIQDILEERCREFYMENDFRWLDMKRLGIKVTRVVQGETYVLEPEDFKYSFPIPRKEIELNKNMEQNPGWDKVILN